MKEKLLHNTREWAETGHKFKEIVGTNLPLSSEQVHKPCRLLLTSYVFTQFKMGFRKASWAEMFKRWLCGLNFVVVFFCQSRVGHWRESPLKMEHAWSQGWATECSKCLSLGLGETWPPGQRLSSQRRLCAYQHHSSQWPRNLLTMQRRPFSPHATSAQDCWSSWRIFWILHSSNNEGNPEPSYKSGGKLKKTYRCKF